MYPVSRPEVAKKSKEAPASSGCAGDFDFWVLPQLCSSGIILM